MWAHPGNAAEQLRNALHRAGHSCGSGPGRAGRPALQAGPRAASLQLGGCSPDQGQSPGPRHVVLGETSWVPDLGSRAAAWRGAVSAAAASPPRTAAGSQGRHNGAAVRGTRLCGQPRSVDRGHIQHWRSGSDPRLAPRSVGGPAQTLGSSRQPEG